MSDARGATCPPRPVRPDAPPRLHPPVPEASGPAPLPPAAASPGAPVDPQRALAELDALLARPRLDDDAIARVSALAPHVPGRLRAAVAALSRTDTRAAIATLLALPRVPGALEAVAGALARGLSGPPPEGASPPLALDFLPSRARPFPDLLRRAQLLAAAPGGAFELAAPRVAGRPHYRLSFAPDRLAPRAREALVRACEPDLLLLLARLGRLRGTRLWLAGFCLDGGGPVPLAAQARLLRAFLAGTIGQAP